jgi:hypothetical protein
MSNVRFGPKADIAEAISAEFTRAARPKIPVYFQSSMMRIWTGNFSRNL